MRLDRRFSGRGSLALGVLLGTGVLLAAPTTARDPAAGDDGRTVAQDALDQLTELASYRLEQTTTTQGSPVGSTGLVVTRVQGDEPALRVEVRYDGEVGLEEVVAGDKGWVSFLGGPLLPMADQGMHVPDPLLPTDGELRMLQVAIEEGFAIEKLGVEDIDEVPATHYRGTTLAPLASPVDGYYQRTLQGTIDLWVATNGGYLVRSDIDVLDNQRPLDRRPGPETFRVTESARVVAVGDEGATITPPPVATPIPEPSGATDPAAAELVRDAIERLSTLDSWQATSATRMMDVSRQVDLTVVNGSPAAVDVTVADNGEPDLAFRIIGDRTYVRTETSEPWRLDTDPDGPGCPSELCTVEDAMALVTVLAGEAGAFTLLGDEVLDGVAAHHLRSEAGITVGDLGRVPAITDVWVAADDGRLLRQATDGQALSVTLTVHHVGDPANALAEPSPFASPEP